GGVEEDHGDHPAQLARLAPVEGAYGLAPQAHAEVGAQQRPELPQVERVPHRASTRANSSARASRCSVAVSRLKMRSSETSPVSSCSCASEPSAIRRTTWMMTLRALTRSTMSSSCDETKTT